MSCSPSYSYRPTFTPGATGCSAPLFVERRGRLFAGGTFFRSKELGAKWNSVQIEVVTAPSNMMNVTVTHPDHPTEFYSVEQIPGTLPEDPPCTTSGIIGLRAAINGNPNSIIEMYPRGNDVNDPGGVDASCLTPFVATLSGADGGPTDGTVVSSIRTGPERTVYIVQLRESANGALVTPGIADRIKQWNGTEWIPYSNATPGVCPL